MLRPDTYSLILRVVLSLTTAPQDGRTKLPQHQIGELARAKNSILKSDPNPQPPYISPVNTDVTEHCH
jgi:hypothetical protein